MVSTVGFSPMNATQPKTQLFQPSNSASFIAVANGEGLYQQWLSNGVSITGATNGTLFLPNWSGSNLKMV
jgi:hypothetical protein